MEEKKEEKSYRDIIKMHVREAIKKRDKCKKKIDKDHWDWVVSELISDLRDYETQGRKQWRREPADEAFKRYGRRRSMMDVDDIFKNLFKDFFG